MGESSNDKTFVFYSDKLSYKATGSGKEKKYFVEGYIATGDLDLVNDIVTKDCLESMYKQFDERNIKLDFEHEAFRGKDDLEAELNKTRVPLGKAVKRYIDDKGVKITWELNSTWKKFDSKGDVTMTFKDLWGNVENEMLDAYSIAYVPTQTANIQRDGKDIRLLDDVNLLNVALTGNPINAGATMTAVMAKSLEFMKGETMKDKREVKNYMEDGKHVHTEEKPMGEHNHPEVEKELERIWDSIYSIQDKIYKLTTSEDGAEKGPGYKDKLKNEVSKVTDKKDEESQGSEAAEGAEAGAEAGQESASSAEGAEGSEGAESSESSESSEGSESEGSEQKSDNKVLLEIKSQITKLTGEVKDLKKENADFKAIVEKAQHKSKGAENKETKGQQNTDSESVGPLDLI